jgi:hypothetical protein
MTEVDEDAEVLRVSLRVMTKVSRVYEQDNITKLGN